MAGVITGSVVVPQSACLRPSNRPVGNLSLPLSLSISRRIRPTATISIVPAQRSNRLMFVVRRKAIEETFALTGLVLKVVGLTFGLAAAHSSSDGNQSQCRSYDSSEASFGPSLMGCSSSAEREIHAEGGNHQDQD